MNKNKKIYFGIVIILFVLLFLFQIIFKAEENQIIYEINEKQNERNERENDINIEDKKEIEIPKIVDIEKEREKQKEEKKIENNIEEQIKKRVEDELEREKGIDYRLQFEQPTFKDNKLDVSNFNFSGSCRDIFIHKPNNKRDLLFVANYYKDSQQWLKDKEDIQFKFSITKSGIPNVTKILLVYGKEPGYGFIDMMTELGYEIIYSDRIIEANSNFNAAVYRYEDCLKYLKYHEGEYDRVAVTDFRDVVFFADGFSTIGFDEIVMATECVKKGPSESIRCIDYYQSSNYNWMGETFGYDLARKYRSEGRVVINVGVIIGGYSKIKKLLTRFNETIYSHKSTTHIWGFDQGMINHLYYSGQLDDLNMVLDPGTQRIGFDAFGGYVYDTKTKVFHLKYNKCGMVIRHKMYGAGYSLGVL